MNLQLQFRQLEDDPRYKEADELYSRLEADIERTQRAVQDALTEDEDDFEAQVEARLKGVTLEPRPAKAKVDVGKLRRELGILQAAYKVATEKRGQVIKTVKAEIARELKDEYHKFIREFAAEAVVYSGFVKDEERLRNAILLEDTGLNLNPLTIGSSLNLFNPGNRDSWIHNFLRGVIGREIMTRDEVDKLLVKQGLRLENWE